jgi:gamma-glutamyl:cysteine ligase YbdK (ATP-grasp superfamily)
MVEVTHGWVNQEQETLIEKAAKGITPESITEEIVATTEEIVAEAEEVKEAPSGSRQRLRRLAAVGKRAGVRSSVSGSGVVHY